MCRFSTDCQLIRTDSFARDFYGALISKRRLHNKSIFTSSCFFNQQLCGTDTAIFFIRIKQAYYLFVENCANLFHSNQSEYRLNYTAFHIVYTRTVSFTIFNFERVAFQCARKLYCIKMTDYKYLLFAISKVLSLIHISEPTRLGMISYAVFCLKKKKKLKTKKYKPIKTYK